MDMVFSPSHYQAGLGPLPSYEHLQNNSPTSHVVTPLPFPLIPSSAPAAAPSQRGPVTGSGRTHISPATTRTEKRGKARREKVSNSEKPRVECCFCKKLIQESGIQRHVNRCKLNPDLVEITCPVCNLVLSRGDSLKRHLDSLTACPGSQSTTPTSAPQLGPSRAARTNHRVSPYTPSPPSSASPATPNDSYEPSPTAKSTQSPQSSYTHYTNNHYARYMARQPESPPSVLSNHSSTPQYTTDQPSPHIYNGNDGPSPPLTITISPKSP
ncbi:hypothetical protein BD779DRAFT_214273 [Infundibulicybe gibba]|nr:hypothetical protein BD779DRAFT_214273 [Infundibulicybe gibba]